MKLKILSVIAFLVIVISGKVCFAVSPKVTWADILVSFTSQYSTTFGAARTILGPPNVMPGFGLSHSGWIPKSVFGRPLEIINVGFSKPVKANHVVVNENYYSGSIAYICLFDTAGNSIPVFENKDPKLIEDGQLFQIDFPETKLPVASLEIRVKADKAYQGLQFDAVGIFDDTLDYFLNVNNAPIGNDYDAVPENLGTNINSPYHEISPIISQDEKSLYFTREGHPDNLGEEKRQDVWVSEKDASGHFGPAKNLGAPINNDYHNFAVSLSADGNSLMLGNKYNTDGTISPGVSVSHKQGGKWSFPQAVNLNLNIKGNNITYNLASNQKVLLVSAQMDDSYGEEDIYALFLQPDGSWSAPMNLGSTINTPSSEVSPFLAADMTTLYFSSDGHPGYGDADFFISRRLDETWQNWSEPQNLGPIFNSDGWDTYFTLPASADYAYFASTKKSLGEEDLYKIKFPEALKPKIVALVSGRVLNANDKLPVPAKIIYEILGKNQNAGKAAVDPETGEYQIVLPAGELYGFLAQADGYLSVNENIDLRNITYYQEVYRDLFLVPVKRGAQVPINNIFFDFAKYDLLPESYPELDRLVEFLKNNTSYNLEIQGHTDIIGTDENNITLSLNRANSVGKYLQDKGIAPARIKTVGFGKSRPVAPNDTEENRAKNRRVEFKLE